jgi:O-antigen biosynthesis protein
MKHILVIDHYVPHFDKDAGSRSTYSYIELLLEMGYNVKFIGDNFFKHEPYTTVLQQLGVEVLYGNYYQKNLTLWLKENGLFFDYVFCNRMHIAPKYFDDLKKYTKAKLIYIGHDLNFMGLKRKYEVTGDLQYLEESKRCEYLERIIFETVDIILPFSTLETEIIRKIVPNKIVETIPVFFYKKFPQSIPGYEERNNLLFVGGFAHPPNVDAILWFVNEIFPLVLRDHSDIKLYIVGSNPPEEVQSLNSDSIIVTGYVDDKELEEYYFSCKVAVIPLRIGAGVKGKLLESLFYQIPAVITPVAAEGVPEINEFCLISDEKNDFASQISKLYSDQELWTKYSDKSDELIEKYFTEDSARQIIEKILIN